LIFLFLDLKLLGFLLFLLLVLDEKLLIGQLDLGHLRFLYPHCLVALTYFYIVPFVSIYRHLKICTCLDLVILIDLFQIIEVLDPSVIIHQVLHLPLLISPELFPSFILLLKLLFKTLSFLSLNG